MQLAATRFGFGVAGAVVIFWFWLLRETPLPDWNQLARSWHELDRVPLEHYMRLGLWVGGLGQVAVALLLGATLVFGSGRKPAPSRTNAQTSCRPGTGFWIGMGLVLLTAAWLRTPRLEVSYFSDEIYTLRHFVRGKWNRKNLLDPPVLDRVSWQETLWDYGRPNNHMLFSASARLALSAWNGPGPGDSERPSSTAVRMPAFLAGLGSIVVAGLLAWRLAGTWAGWWCALFLAWHPWHLFHSTSARGYAFVFLFSLLVLLCLEAVLRTRRGGWWIGYAASASALVLTYPAMVYFLAVVNLVLLTGVWRADWRRWAAANLAAGAVVLPFLVAWFPQLRIYFARFAPKGNIVGGGWMQDELSLQFAGLPWKPFAEDHPLAVSLSDAAVAHPALCIALGTLFLTLLLAGVAGVFRKDPRMGSLLMCLPAAGVLSTVLAARNGDFVYLWYPVWVMPAWFVFVGVGLSSGAWPDGRKQRQFLPVAAAALATGFLWVGSPMTRLVRVHGKEPIKEIAAKVASLRKESPSLIAAGFWRNVEIYDPSAIALHRVRELRDLMAEAGRSRRGLVVWVGYWPVLSENLPALKILLEESGRFEKVETFRGLESPNSDYRLYRLLPAPQAPRQARLQQATDSDFRRQLDYPISKFGVRANPTTAG